MTDGDNATVRNLLAAHPRESSRDRDVLARCIDACLECAAACTACADASLGERGAQNLIRCIRRCQDCADACAAAGRIVTRQTELDTRVVRAAIEACATTCRVCGDECDRHAAHHEHCRICAEVCRRCEQACRDLVAVLA